jgi:hypothetical protein
LSKIYIQVLTLVENDEADCFWLGSRSTYPPLCPQSHIPFANIYLSDDSPSDSNDFRSKFLFLPITKELLSKTSLLLIAVAHRRNALKPEEFATHDME